MNKFFKNWKTTVPGLIGGVANILTITGVYIVDPITLTSINATVIFMIGLFANDAQSTESTEVLEGIETSSKFIGKKPPQGGN